MSDANPAWQPFDPSDRTTRDIPFSADDGLIALVCSDIARMEGWGPDVAAGLALGGAGDGTQITLWDLALTDATLGARLRDLASEPSSGSVGEGVMDVLRYGASLDRVTQTVGALRFVGPGTVDPDPAEAMAGDALLPVLESALDKDGGTLLLYAWSDDPWARDVVESVGRAVWIGTENEPLPDWLAEGEARVLARIGVPVAGLSDSVDDAAQAPVLQAPLMETPAVEIPVVPTPVVSTDDADFAHAMDDHVDDPGFDPRPFDRGDGEWAAEAPEPETSETEVTESADVQLDGVSVYGDDERPEDVFGDGEDDEVTLDLDDAWDPEPDGGVEPDVAPGRDGDADAWVEDVVDTDVPVGAVPDGEAPGSEASAAPWDERAEPEAEEIGGIEIEPEWPEFGAPLVVANPGDIDPLDASAKDRPRSPADFDFGVDVAASEVLDQTIPPPPDPSGVEFQEGEPHVDLDEALGEAAPDPWSGTGTFGPDHVLGPGGAPGADGIERMKDLHPEEEGRPPTFTHDPRPRPDVSDRGDEPHTRPVRRTDARSPAPVADVTRTATRGGRPRGFMYVLFILFILTIAVLAWAGYVEIPGIDWFQGDTP